MNSSVTDEQPTDEGSSAVEQPATGAGPSSGGGFRFLSQLTGSISDLDRLRRSLLFAELSNLSYYDENFVREGVTQIGLSEVCFFNRDGSQAYMLTGEHDRIIACRGTEPNDWNDIKADANAVAVEALVETAGRVHRGFKQEVDDLWPLLEKALVDNDKNLWFTGHSLGGAMATICAGRCMLSHISSTPRGLFTFGSPRVGDKRYINYCDIHHVRWVNNNDVVTRVPPPWFGFRHHGTEMYLDCNGRIRRMSGWQRSKDRIRGFLRGLMTFKIDHFADHSIDRYIEYIHSAVVENEKTPVDRAEAQNPGKPR